MKKVIFVILFVFLLSNVFALCEEGQIDINTASAEELDKLYGVGKTIAGNIINYRNENKFDSVDELIEVSRIGEKTLNQIKEQGLACVNNEEEKEGQQTEIIDGTKEDENLKITDLKGNEINKSPEKVELTSIKLNAKNIKREDDKRNLQNNLALEGIIIFCFIFGALFLLREKKYKNEFQ